MAVDYPDLDAFSLTLEKLETLVSLALGDGCTQGKYMLVVLAIIGDYTAELRRMTTDVATGGAR